MNPENIHTMLSKQLSKAGLSKDTPPKGEAVWKALVDQISRSYEDAETLRQRLERDLRFSSAEVEYLKKQLAELESKVLEVNLSLEDKQSGFVRLQEEHQKIESLYRSILAVSPDEIIIADMDGTIRMLSPKAFRTFGYRSNDELVGCRLFDCLAPEDRGRARSNIQLRLMGKVTGPVEYCGICADGSKFDIDLNTDFIRNQEGQPLSMVVAVRDISSRKLAEQALVNSKQMYSRLIANIPVGVYSMRSVADGRFWIEYVSPRMIEMMGMNSAGNLISDINNAFRAIHPEEREGFARQHIHVIRNHEPFEWEGRTLAKGEVKWVRIVSYPMPQANEDLIWTGVVTDITEQKLVGQALEESNRKLELLSITDGLTGIANRRRFDEALAVECGRHIRSGGKLSLILLDIDHFKRFNDIYGHVDGDECLRRVATVLADCAARVTDIPARYGGEEFACIMPETDINGAVAIAEKIRSGIQALGIPHEGSNTANCVTASLGVLTVQPVLEGSVHQVLNKVDELLYKAKDGGRNRIEYGLLQNYAVDR